MTGDVHVVFGSGPVGRATAVALVGRGLPVRIVNRRGREAFGRDAEALREVDRGDGRGPDAAFATRAAQGAASVYQTLNPEYHRWAEDFPPLQRSVLAAAEANGARFVNMDNVYSYGRPGGRPLTEESPQEPHTRKGRVRLDMADELWAAHRAGRVEVVSGRASDYYGPGAGIASPLGDRVLGARRRRQAGLAVRRPRPRAQLHVPPRHRRGPRGARHPPRASPGRRGTCRTIPSRGRAAPWSRSSSGSPAPGAHRQPAEDRAARRRDLQPHRARTRRDGVRVR